MGPALRFSFLRLNASKFASVLLLVAADLRAATERFNRSDTSTIMAARRSAATRLNTLGESL
jgi:hypothetical protein